MTNSINVPLLEQCTTAKITNSAKLLKKVLLFYSIFFILGGDQPVQENVQRCANWTQPIQATMHTRYNFNIFSRKILFEFSNLFVAIRQWDQALREKTEYKDALTKVSWLVKLRAWNTWKLHGFFSCYTLFETTNFYPKIQFFRTVQNIVNKNFWAKKISKKSLIFSTTIQLTI